MNASKDPRRALAEDWLTQQATALAGLGWSVDPASLTAASSDASFRRYFRITGQRGGQSQCLILMDAPPEKESIGPFIKIATLLRQAGVNAPNIWRHDAGQGFLLCDDFGVTTYASAIERRQHDAAACAPLYRDAHQALVRLQRFSLHQHLKSRALSPTTETKCCRRCSFLINGFLFIIGQSRCPPLTARCLSTRTT